MMGLAMADPQTLPEIADEARRVVAEVARRGEILRITGGVAFHLRVAGRVTLPRPPLQDIDLMAPRRRERHLVHAVTELGYVGEKEFNARHGDERLVFWDTSRERKLEIFLGAFVMCHTVPMTGRLEVDSETIPLADLLLTKLQIVELNEKDLSDMHALLLTHEVADDDDDRINAQHIARLCARDWGLHHTVSRTLTRLAEDPPSYMLSGEQRRVIEERTGELRSALEDQPKAMAWRARARIGERVRWYEEPEEI
jgi:hypothetical protein